MNKLNIFDWVFLALLFIGGLNWGMVGLFGFDVVSTIFGEGSLLSRIIFVIVGVAAFYSLLLSAPKIGSWEKNSSQDEA